MNIQLSPGTDDGSICFYYDNQNVLTECVIFADGRREYRVVGFGYHRTVDSLPSTEANLALMAVVGRCYELAVEVAKLDIATGAYAEKYAELLREFHAEAVAP